MRLPLAALILMILAGAAASNEQSNELGGATLKSCPSGPNCVSSDAGDSSHHVEGFSLVDNTEKAWQTVIAVVREQPRTEVTLVDDARLSAEVSSRVFGFVDDLDLEYRAGTGSIAVRSASRTGYWDLGANRSRVESLREALRSRGLIR